MKASHVRKLIKPIESAYSEMFSGRVYRVGKGAVSVRNHSGKAEHTVICVHGFLENHCYFTQAYEAPTTELILLTCSNYHIPVNGVTPETPDWEVPIKSLDGTIEYDARILNQALENLPTTDNIRVHGHSRGGAVILEAIRLRPELYETVEVVLEAPVLPQGKLSSLVTMVLEPVSHGMWPWVIRLINSAPSSAYGQTFFGKMNPRKKVLLSKLFSATRDTSIYQHVRQGTFLIPAVDRILDRTAMLNSARKSPTTMRIVETQAPSHFIILDSKKWVPDFGSLPSAAQG
jgi:pimeloyl-ACP methyl ester carboxylesterase